MNSYRRFEGLQMISTVQDECMNKLQRSLASFVRKLNCSFEAISGSGPLKLI